MDASRLTILHGTDEPPAERRRFRAGPLCVEAEAGSLLRPRRRLRQQARIKGRASATLPESVVQERPILDIRALTHKAA